MENVEILENIETETTLLDILNYYKANVLPYKYEVCSRNSLKLEFEIDKKSICHLLLGTVSDGMASNIKLYKGERGYNGIEDGSVTFKNLPKPILKYANNRMYDFLEIDSLLKNDAIGVNGIFFLNENVNLQKNEKNDILKRLNILKPSNIDADFMIYKKINNQKYMQLFLKNQGSRLIPVSFFCVPITPKNPGLHFIERQKAFKVFHLHKIAK